MRGTLSERKELVAWLECFIQDWETLSYERDKKKFNIG